MSCAADEDLRSILYLCHMISDLENYLLRREVRPTASRLLLLRVLREAECALSLSDLEAEIPTLDKSTIFRTLTTFTAHHLVHHIDDGTGQTKYALCSEHCHCGELPEDDPRDLHLHFYCERCRRTFCLPDSPIPTPLLPPGFSLHSAGYVVRGICPKCRHKGTWR